MDKVNEELDRFLAEVRAEVLRARAKFPTNLQQLAVKTEEDGELAKALIDHDRGEATAAEVYAEAVQSAAMAVRVALEGSAEFERYPE